MRPQHEPNAPADSDDAAPAPLLELPEHDQALDTAMAEVGRVVAVWLGSVESEQRRLDDRLQELERRENELEHDRAQLEAEARTKADELASRQRDLEQRAADLERRATELQHTQDEVEQQRQELDARERKTARAVPSEAEATENQDSVESPGTAPEPESQVEHRSVTVAEVAPRPDAVGEDPEAVVESPSPPDPERPPEAHPVREAEPDIASMDLDPETLQKLKVLRRIAGPDKSNAELLAQLQARDSGRGSQRQRKKKWWS